jgi:hypothetical protein
MARDFSLVQAYFGAHPAYYAVDTEDLFPGVKQLGSETDHSSQSSTEPMNAWSYIAILLSLWIVAQLKHRGNLFTFTVSPSIHGRS